MSNRHLSRTIAMQTLYEWDFNHRSQKIRELIKRNIKENFIDGDSAEFVETLVLGVIKKMAEVDEEIQKHAPEWPIEKITVVDRNILRIGLYELLHNNKVPVKVIINEAIEMAKAFGGTSSSKFINGVLGSILNDLNQSDDLRTDLSDQKIQPPATPKK